MEQKKSTSQLGNYQRLATLKQQVMQTKMNSLPVEIQLKWIWKGFTISCKAKACQSSKQQGLTIERLQRIHGSASSEAINLATILWVDIHTCILNTNVNVICVIIVIIQYNFKAHYIHNDRYLDTWRCFQNWNLYFVYKSTCVLCLSIKLSENLKLFLWELCNIHTDSFIYKRTIYEIQRLSIVANWVYCETPSAKKYKNKWKN